MKSKYYSLDAILSKEATYNIIIGERSNGKTYAALKYGLEKTRDGEQFAVIRRWQDDFRGKRAATMFDSLVVNGVIENVTNGAYKSVFYYSGRWYFCNYDDKGKKELSPEPFAFAFALTSMEHDKSTSYPKISTIIFDEFLSRTMYLPEEFILFMNTVSTIVRDRDTIKIFMLGNTVNAYSPYFDEMGLTHIKTMAKGSIDSYEYGESGLRVAVEYADNPQKRKASDKYFAFDNPKLAMITGGEWEIDIYPHCPVKYFKTDILLSYFIMFDKEILQADIIKRGESAFTYIHRKSTEIKDMDKDIIYSLEYDPRPNHHRNILKPRTRKEKKIAEFFARDKVFYQDNTTGEIVRNYLMCCKE